VADLENVARQIQIDLLAEACCSALREARIGHILLKGPTTARWLYDPPRTYVDVDLLIEPGRMGHAAVTVEAAGLGSELHERPGEEASHSHVLLSRLGVEIDLHLTLPMVNVGQSREVWRALQPHVVNFKLVDEDVPALDVPARCLVLALHCLASGAETPKVVEDLRRARDRAERTDWEDAETIAEAIGLNGYLNAAFALLDGTIPEVLSLLPLDVRLRLVGAPGSSFQLARLRELPTRLVPAALWREAFPSRGFMQRQQPDLVRERLGLARAYARRLRFLALQLPEAVRAMRAVERHGGHGDNVRP